MLEDIHLCLGLYCSRKRQKWYQIGSIFCHTGLATTFCKPTLQNHSNCLPCSQVTHLQPRLQFGLEMDWQLLDRNHLFLGELIIYWAQSISRKLNLGSLWSQSLGVGTGSVFENVFESAISKRLMTFHESNFFKFYVCFEPVITQFVHPSSTPKVWHAVLPLDCLTNVSLTCCDHDSLANNKDRILRTCYYHTTSNIPVYLPLVYTWKKRNSNMATAHSF